MSIPELGDSITVSGLRVFAHHGVFESEREDGQEFVIDVTVWLDLSPAATGDSLADTIHYGELAVEVAEAVKNNPVDLIETVAERVAQVVLAHDAADGVRVTVHKPAAPIEVQFDDVAVSITRMKQSSSQPVGFGR